MEHQTSMTMGTENSRIKDSVKRLNIIFLLDFIRKIV
jgi:hypothetical protein